MPSERTVRIGVVLLGLIAFVAGLVALLAPGTFYEDIGTYPPRNDHYIGDTGAFTTAFGAALILCARRPSWREPLLLLGAGWYALHALNHAFDVGEARSETRGLVDTVAIALGAVAHLVFARLSPRAR